MLALTTYRLLKDNSREGLEIKSKFIHKFTFVKCEKYMDKIETLLKKDYYKFGGFHSEV